MSTHPSSGPQGGSERLAPQAVIGRMGLYLRQLETWQKQGDTRISSRRLGLALGIRDAQVRKDLAYFGQFGQPGIGYPITELVTRLREILGVNRIWPIALIGFGNLGRALIGYHGFQEHGFRIVAVFDEAPEKIGRAIGLGADLVVQPIAELDETVRRHRIRMAMLCVPGSVAQGVADRLVRAGVQGIYNFAPTTIQVPSEVRIISVDLSVQLEHLAYQVLHTGGATDTRLEIRRPHLDDI